MTKNETLIFLKNMYTLSGEIRMVGFDLNGAQETAILFEKAADFYLNELHDAIRSTAIYPSPVTDNSFFEKMFNHAIVRLENLCETAKNPVIDRTLGAFKNEYEALSSFEKSSPALPEASVLLALFGHRLMEYAS